MADAEQTVLTDRQLEVLERRSEGATQREIAERLGTTAANVSAIERAAEENIEKAKKTVEVARMIGSPVRFRVESGERFDDIVDEIYQRADTADIHLGKPRPEMSAYLYSSLQDHANQYQVGVPVEIGITTKGSVEVVRVES